MFHPSGVSDGTHESLVVLDISLPVVETVVDVDQGLGGDRVDLVGSVDNVFFEDAVKGGLFVEEYYPQGDLRVRVE